MKIYIPIFGSLILIGIIFFSGLFLGRYIRGTETEPIDELSGGESPDSKSDDPDPEPAIDDNDELTDEDLDALDDAIAELENAVEGGI